MPKCFCESIFLLYLFLLCLARCREPTFSTRVKKIINTHRILIMSTGHDGMEKQYEIFICFIDGGHKIKFIRCEMSNSG